MFTLIAGVAYVPLAQWYYILCAVFILGGLFSLFFAGENFAKHAGGISTWVLCGFLFAVGVTLLYVGFSSIIEFQNGHHSTIDSLLDNVEAMHRYIRS